MCACVSDLVAVDRQAMVYVVVSERSININYYRADEPKIREGGEAVYKIRQKRPQSAYAELRGLNAEEH